MSEQTRVEDPARDRALVASLAAGESEALGELYDRHAAAMLGLAMRVLGGRRDAEDLLHDVFLEVWRRSSRYDPARGTVRAWLLVVVRSRAIDRLRSLSVARRFGSGVPLDVCTGDSEAELRVLRSVDGSRVLDALEALPEAQREVVSMMYVQGFTTSEIASRCSLPLGTVKSRLSRAMAVLRERLPQLPDAGQ